MPKSKYQIVWDYKNRPVPKEYEEVRKEWFNDEDTVWTGSFDRWLFEKVQNESEENDG